MQRNANKIKIMTRFFLTCLPCAANIPFSHKMKVKQVCFWWLSSTIVFYK